MSRRDLLARAGRVGLGAGVLPLAALAAACAPSSSSGAPATPSPSPSPSATPRAQPQPAQTQTTAADTRPVSVAITGDVMLGRTVNTRILSTSDRYPFNFTADYLRGFDLTVGNLECVVSSAGGPVANKPYHFRCDPAACARLTGAGFDIVSVANNHTGDYGTAAFVDMLAQLHAHGITPLGGGMTLAQAHRPVVRTVRSTTIGFLAYCEIGPTSFAATPTSPGHAWLDAGLMQSDIAASRPHVDYLIVFMHWGIEYQTSPSGHQQAMAHLAIDAGADLVVGAHPHVIQPPSVYRGKPIVHSLGNFVFDEMWSDDRRRGEVLTLTIQGSQLLEWKLRQSYIVGDLGQPHWV